MRSLLLAGVLLFSTASNAGYTAREWGTFTSLVGSNGLSQNGMYHEDEKLPDFVHGYGVVQSDLSRPFPGHPVVDPDSPRHPPNCPPFSKACFDPITLQNNEITQKMETPVIYFYADEATKVKINVKFPSGVITETYPAPVATFPTRRDVPVLANGDTTFEVDVLNQKAGAIPFVSDENIYSHARKVPEANLVRSGMEAEKFVFYRGLGTFQPKLKITSAGGGLRVTANPRTNPLGAFLVDVDSSGSTRAVALKDFLSFERNSLEVYQYDISALAIAQLQNHTGKEGTLPSVLTGDASKSALISTLVEAGLSSAEASAMINTWENGYLKTPGLRLLYVLPKHEVEEILPISFEPRPDSLDRVFVGRIEVMLDTKEQEILQSVLAQRDAFKVESLGRMAEPMIRRVSQIYAGTDKEVRKLFNRLIQDALEMGN